jgi:two-component system, OmpR family, response regulator RegX3
VEDEDSISEPFSELLRSEGYDPVIARSVSEALSLAEQLHPDLVLLDLMLPDGDGRDVCREIRRRSDVPILMLTARADVTDRVIGLELGADDYVTKPFSAAEVISRVRALLRRSQGASRRSDDVRRVGDLEVDLDAHRVTFRDEELALSRKEFDLLAVLIRNAGRVVRREDLMAEVWDENWFGSTRTLDVHIGWLRRKLGDDASAPRMIQTVRGVGFRLRNQEDSPSA